MNRTSKHLTTHKQYTLDTHMTDPKDRTERNLNTQMTNEDRVITQRVMMLNSGRRQMNLWS